MSGKEAKPVYAMRYRPVSSFTLPPGIVTEWVRTPRTDGLVVTGAFPPPAAATGSSTRSSGGSSSSGTGRTTSTCRSAARPSGGDRGGKHHRQR